MENTMMIVFNVSIQFISFKFRMLQQMFVIRWIFWKRKFDRKENKWQKILKILFKNLSYRIDIDNRWERKQSRHDSLFYQRKHRSACLLSLQVFSFQRKFRAFWQSIMSVKGFASSASFTVCQNQEGYRRCTDIG